LGVDPSSGEKFYLYQDRAERVEAVGAGAMTRNGHCSYLAGNRWILNDTYPDKERNQNVYLYEVATGRRVPVGSFHSPPEYTGEWRCDTIKVRADGKRPSSTRRIKNGGRCTSSISVRWLREEPAATSPGTYPG
jgi:hypothetical protein